jgi:hypothetical protein
LRTALIVLAYLAAGVVAALAVARLLHWADTPDTKTPTLPSKRRRRRPYRGMGAALIASLAPARFPAVATPFATPTTATPQCPTPYHAYAYVPATIPGWDVSSTRLSGLYACGETVYCPVSSRRASTLFNSATPIALPATYLPSGANGLQLVAVATASLPTAQPLRRSTARLSTTR